MINSADLGVAIKLGWVRGAAVKVVCLKYGRCSSRSESRDGPAPRRALPIASVLLLSALSVPLMPVCPASPAAN